jgi:hypothetical protein
VILADSSAWVAHARRLDPRLVRHLEANQVVTCEALLGQLLLVPGLPADLVRNVGALPRVPSPDAATTGAFVEAHLQHFREGGLDWGEALVVVAAARAGARLYSAEPGVCGLWRALGFPPG